MAPELQAARPPRRDELMRFYRNLGVMLESGVSFSQSFHTLARSLTDPAMKVVCQDLSRAIEQEGDSLSAAMARRRSVFSNFHVGLIEAGEAGGDVSRTLVQLAQVEEKSWQLRQRLRSALVYPVFVLTLCALLVGWFLPLYVFPQMLQVLDGLHAPATPLTEVMRLTQTPVFLLSMLALLALTVWTATGARRRDRWLRSFLRALVWVPAIRPALRMAIRQARSEEALLAQGEAFLMDYAGPVGRALQQTLTARFCLALAASLDSGVELQKALDVSARATGSHLLSLQIRDVREAVRAGTGMAESLQAAPLFPRLFLQMMLVGEETGSVSELCARTARLYEDELDATLEAALALLEPALMLAMGVLVGGIVLTMMVPMMGVLQQL